MNNNPHPDHNPNETQTRGEQVHERLRILGPLYTQSKFELAELLEECHLNGYWATSHKSFADYVEDIGLCLRTAQEYVRIARRCREADVPMSEVAKLGWSKVAMVAKKLTKENASDVLAKVKSQSFGQLQETARQEKQQTQGEGSAKSRDAHRVQNAELIAVSRQLSEALRLACLHTHDPNMQANLDFIASKFVELCPVPSRFAINDSLN